MFLNKTCICLLHSFMFYFAAQSELGEFLSSVNQSNLAQYTMSNLKPDEKESHVPAVWRMSLVYLKLVLIIRK